MKSEIPITFRLLAGRIRKGDSSAWRDRIGQYGPLQRRQPVANIAAEPEKNAMGESPWHQIL